MDERDNALLAITELNEAIERYEYLVDEPSIEILNEGLYNTFSKSDMKRLKTITLAKLFDYTKKEIVDEIKEKDNGKEVEDYRLPEEDRHLTINQIRTFVIANGNSDDKDAIREKVANIDKVIERSQASKKDEFKVSYGTINAFYSIYKRVKRRTLKEEELLDIFNEAETEDLTESFESDYGDFKVVEMREPRAKEIEDDIKKHGFELVGCVESYGNCYILKKNNKYYFYDDEDSFGFKPEIIKPYSGPLNFFNSDGSYNNNCKITNDSAPYWMKKNNKIIRLDNGTGTLTEQQSLSDRKFATKYDPKEYVAKTTNPTAGEVYKWLSPLRRLFDTNTSTEDLEAKVRERGLQRVYKIEDYPELTSLVNQIETELEKDPIDRKTVKELYKKFKQMYQKSTVKKEVRNDEKIEKLKGKQITSSLYEDMVIEDILQ